ncbi:MAG: hypothetical protein ACYC35_15870 [Pirellulales bacterium]
MANSTRVLTFVGAAFLAALCVGFQAEITLGAITVDGDLADWGVTLRNGPHVNGSRVYPPPPTTSSDFRMQNFSVLNPSPYYLVLTTSGNPMIEDSDDTDNNYYVGPNYGGQNYDAEFMAVALEGEWQKNSSGEQVWTDRRMYIAIVSGQRPDNGPRLFAPGDIRIETTDPNTTFGIEVGGPLGHAVTGTNLNPDDGSVALGADGSFYNLDVHGYTNSQNVDTVHKAGSIWRNPTWNIDTVSDGDPTQLQLTGGESAGTATAYSFKWITGSVHSVIEVSLDLADLQGYQLSSIEWRPACGNDVVYVNGFPEFAPPPPQVPEPTAFCVWGGMIGLAISGAFWRKRAMRNAG